MSPQIALQKRKGKGAEGGHCLGTYTHMHNDVMPAGQQLRPPVLSTGQEKPTYPHRGHAALRDVGAADSEPGRPSPMCWPLAMLKSQPAGTLDTGRPHQWLVAHHVLNVDPSRLSRRQHNPAHWEDGKAAGVGEGGPETTLALQAPLGAPLALQPRSCRQKPPRTAPASLAGWRCGMGTSECHCEQRRHTAHGRAGMQQRCDSLAVRKRALQRTRTCDV